jgi:hypothetical protein
VAEFSARPAPTVKPAESCGGTSSHHSQMPLLLLRAISNVDVFDPSFPRLRL